MNSSKNASSPMPLSHIQKRDGRLVPFDPQKIYAAILSAAQAVGLADEQLCADLADAVVLYLKGQFKQKTPKIEDVQDLVEKVLMNTGQNDVAKAFILYRQKRSQMRKQVKVVDSETAQGQEDLALQFAHEPWRPDYIREQLLLKTSLSLKPAQAIVSAVEQRIFAAGFTSISKECIVQLVNNELREAGFQDRLQSTKQLRLPKAQLEQAFMIEPAEASSLQQMHKNVGDFACSAYIQQHVFKGAVHKACREGRLSFGPEPHLPYAKALTMTSSVQDMPWLAQSFVGTWDFLAEDAEQLKQMILASTQLQGPICHMHVPLSSEVLELLQSFAGKLLNPRLQISLHVSASEQDFLKSSLQAIEHLQRSFAGRLLWDFYKKLPLGAELYGLKPVQKTLFAGASLCLGAFSHRFEIDLSALEHRLREPQAAQIYLDLMNALDLCLEAFQQKCQFYERFFEQKPYFPLPAEQSACLISLRGLSAFERFFQSNPSHKEGALSWLSHMLDDKTARFHEQSYKTCRIELCQEEAEQNPLIAYAFQKRACGLSLSALKRLVQDFAQTQEGFYKEPLYL